MQSIRPELRAAGFALYAVSYDSVEVLNSFAVKHGVDYPLLSDEGSQVIRSLGILNEAAAETVFGIPHPGTFVLNEDGTVRNKEFYSSYRERDSGVGVLEHLLGLDSGTHGTMDEAETTGVTVRGWFDKDTYAWGQRIWLTVELQIGDGLHVYGRPIPEGYYPLAVEIEPLERLIIGEAEFPAAVPFRVKGLDARFHVYEGCVRVRVPVTFMLVDGGTLEIAFNVSFQACSASECFVPQTVRMVLPISELPLVDRPQQRT